MGDAGINYYLDERDKKLKEKISKYPITLFCIHGNHEERPQNIKSYILKHTGYFFYWSEPDYPNIFFAQDGAMSLYGKKFFVLGGAYSIDKYYRLSKGWKWFEDEQMSLKNRNTFLKWTTSTKSFDYVLSHTAPLSKEPTHLFLANIDQSTVDKSMEEFLEKIKNQIEFKKWFFGHYHSDEIIDDKFRLMYNDIIELDLTK